MMVKLIKFKCFDISILFTERCRYTFDGSFLIDEFFKIKFENVLKILYDHQCLPYEKYCRCACIYDCSELLKEYLPKIVLDTDIKKINRLMEHLIPVATKCIPIFVNNKLKLAPRFKTIAVLLNDPRIDPSFNQNQLLKLVCTHNQEKLLRTLLSDSRVDPTARNNIAIRIASKKGYTSMVKILLDDGRVNPHALNDYALRMAKNHEIVKLLRHSDSCV